jgi:hypothetical protein
MKREVRADVSSTKVTVENEAYGVFVEIVDPETSYNNGYVSLTKDEARKLVASLQDVIDYEPLDGEFD